MSLSLYDTSGRSDPKSKDGSYSNPLVYNVAAAGGTIERLMYLRSDDYLNEQLTDCMIRAEDSTAPNEASWFQFAPDINGAPGTYSSSYSFDLDIGDELPLWIKLTVPANQGPVVKTDVKIKLSWINSEIFIGVAVLCPELVEIEEHESQGSIGYYGIALTNDGVMYTDSNESLVTMNFSNFEIVDSVDIEDMNFPINTFVEELYLFWSGGFTTTGYDDYLYTWISNDVGTGQQIIAKFDRNDLSNPTVLYNPGETPPDYSYFRHTALTWHPLTPNVLWAIHTQVNPNFPNAFTIGQSYLLSISLSTGAATQVIDITTIAPLVGIWSMRNYQLQQWDRGVLFPVLSVDNRVIIVAFDVAAQTYGTYTYSANESTFYGYSSLPEGGHGYGIIIGRSIAGPITPLSIE